MNKRLGKKKKGFTLVELIVVIAILGILAGIAVPKFGAARTDAANVAHNANVRTLQSAAMMYIASNADPTVAVGEAETKLADYLQEWPSIPPGAEVGTETKYTVSITKAGVVEVSPAKIN